MTRFHQFLLFSAIILGIALALPAHAAGAPKNVAIPSIGVKAVVEPLGVTKAGAMIAPKSAWTVAWYNQGPKPGDIGNAVMYGHLNTVSSKTAVFTRLNELKMNDRITVTDASGVQRVFRVTKTATYPLSKVPMNLLAGPTKEAHLNFYTCAGTWSRRAGNYSHRLVVYTTLESSQVFYEASK